MKELIRGCINAVDAASHEVVIQRAVSEFAQGLGFERYAYIQAVGPDIVPLTNYSPSWRNDYFNQALSKVDPVLWQAKQVWRPFYWSAETWKGKAASRELRQFRDQAIDHGLRSGLSMPVEGSYGRLLMLTLASARDAPKRPLPDDAALFASLVLAIQYNLKLTAGRASVFPKKLLSPREAVCLRWLARGYRIADIAQMLNVAPGTVQNYLDHLRDKLNARTLAQAVAVGKDQKLV